MPLLLRIIGPVLVCFLLVEGCIHTHDIHDGHEASGDQGCFLCTFLSGAETGPPPAAVESCPCVPDDAPIIPVATDSVSPEPLTVAGNRSPPA